MATADQSSFLGGVVSREFWATPPAGGRETRLAKGINTLLDTEGSLRRRPGTFQVPGWSHEGIARLVPFRQSNTNQFMLVFTDLNMDVFKGGRIIKSGIKTPWPEADLLFDPEDDSKPGLKFFQSIDFLVVTHPNHLPQEISYISDVEWKFSPVNETRKASTAKGLTVNVTGGTQNSPDFSFRHMVIGISEDDRFLSEVTADEIDIENVEIDDGVLKVRVTADNDPVEGIPRTGGIELGDRVILRDIKGSTEVNDNSYRVVSLEGRNMGVTTEYKTTGVHRASSPELARQAARAALGDYTDNISYTENVSTGDRTGRRAETRHLRINFIVLNRLQSALPDRITSAQIQAALQGGGILRSGERISFPNSDTDISSGQERTHHNTYGSVTWNAGRELNITGDSNRILLNTINLGGHPFASKIFTVIVQLTRTVTFTLQGTQNVYLASARGSKTVEAAEGANNVIGLETEIKEISEYVSGGKMFTYVKNSTGKRNSQIRLNWTDVSPEVHRFVVYQSAEQGFALAGATTGPETQIELQNVAGDPKFSPPFYRNPFNHSNPQCSSVYDARRAYGGFQFERENEIEFSQPVFLDKFDASQPLQDGDAFSIPLDSLELNDIRHMERLRNTLFCLTGGGMWSVSGSGAPNITPYNAGANQEQFFGSSHLKPILIGSNMLHLGETGDTIYETGLNTTTDRHVTKKFSEDFSELIRDQESHLIDWGFTEGRRNVILGALRNGNLLAITYDPSMGAKGASLWTLGGGYKAKGVQVMNLEDKSPLAVILAEKDGVSHLWTMNFRDGNDFLADGITRHDPVSELPREGKWIQYIENGFPKSEDISRGFEFPKEHRVPYMKGYNYDVIAEIMPRHSMKEKWIKSGQIRMLQGSGVKIRGLPGGALSRIKPTYGSASLLRGTYRFELGGPGQLDYSFGAQIQILQDRPEKFILLGLTYDNSEEESDGAR